MVETGLCILSGSLKGAEVKFSSPLLLSTAIATVAVEVLYDKDTLKYCRKDSIIADAAYVMLTRESKTRTGEYLYDEEVLMEEGITDFNQYLVSPGEQKCLAY